jgi:hypothetical protein
MMEAYDVLRLVPPPSGYPTPGLPRVRWRGGKVESEAERELIREYARNMDAIGDRLECEMALQTLAWAGRQ